jgi:hypothetical protein
MGDPLTLDAPQASSRAVHRDRRHANDQRYAQDWQAYPAIPRNDSRPGPYERVELKSDRRPENRPQHRVRMLLSSREMLVRMLIDLDNMSPCGLSST